MTRKISRLALSTVLAAAAMPATVALAGKAARGGVVVQNKRSESIQVIIDGELVGVLPAGGRSGFPAKEGRHHVQLKDADGGIILGRRVSVEKGERTRVRLGAAEATVLIDNDSEVAISVKSLDRRGSRRVLSVAPGTERLVKVAPGDVDLNTYHTWFDVEMSLASKDLRLEPGELERFVIQPLDEAPVRVDNPSDVSLAVSMGDEFLGRVAAESVAYVMVPLGRQTVELTTLGVDAGSRRVEVSAESGGSMTYIHRAGTLELINRSAQATRVSVGGRDHGWLRPGQVHEVELPAGVHVVEFRASDGELVKQARVRMTREASKEVLFLARQPVQGDALAEARSSKR